MSDFAKDTNVPANDCISRQAAIDEVNKYILSFDAIDANFLDGLKTAIRLIKDNLPSAEPTLYGYKIEHLAYIARVMQKEGVTAEYAVRTFDDMSRAIKMIIEEAQQKVEEALSERFNQQTGGT